MSVKASEKTLVQILEKANSWPYNSIDIIITKALKDINMLMEFDGEVG